MLQVSLTFILTKKSQLGAFLAVHCEPITAELDEHMTMRSEGTKLGQKTYFQCQSGYQINGDHNITCQLSGKISNSFKKYTV